MKFHLFRLSGPASSILLLALMLISCQKSPPARPSIVSGHLPDLVSGELMINVGDREYRANTDEEGYFRMKLDMDQDRYLLLKGVPVNLYLLAGDSLHIGKNPGSDSFSFTGGESALINTWYGVKETKSASLLDTVNINDYYSQDAPSFRKLNTWLISEFHDLLDHFCLENPGIPESFIKLEKENIKHYWYYELNVYHIENPAYTGKKPHMPEDFYDYLESVHLNDAGLFQYPGYRYFLYSWVDLQLFFQNKTLSGIQKTHQIFDLAEEVFTNPEILADVVWENLRLQNSRMNVDEQILDRAKALGVAEEQVEKARKYMENLRDITPGNVAPDFEIIALDGRTKSLNAFRGKYLLMDIWSTTCSPCIREIPRMEDLKHALKDRNMEVIAVCLSREDPWKNKLLELGMSGEGQYRADEGWSSAVSTDYLRGSGVPVYVIIDPEGKIVTTRAPYPSQGLKELLDTLPI